MKNRQEYIKGILSILGIGLSKRDIKEVFNLSEHEFERLIDIANENGEMKCEGALYYFFLSKIPDNIVLKDTYYAIIYYLTKVNDEIDSIFLILNRVRESLSITEIEYVYFSLGLGEYAESNKNRLLAIQLYRYAAELALEIDIDQRKRALVRSVLKLSKLEFMRGVSPDSTLELQRMAIALIHEGNLTAEDALLYMYIGMGEHFAGSLEEGETYRNKGIKYMKQFDYDNLEAEAVPLIGWHNYLEGDFRKTIAYYESFILAIENREDEEIITFAYPPIIFSYFFIGEPNRALALAETIYQHALRNNDTYAEILLKAIKGRVLLYLNQYNTAEKIFDEAMRDAKELSYGWGMYYVITGRALLALKNNNIKDARQNIILSRKIAEEFSFAPIIASPFVLEILKEIKDLGLEPITDFGYDAELIKYIKSNNVQLKGLGFRHLAIKKISDNSGERGIIGDLKASAYYLELSGNNNELAKTYIVAAKFYLSNNNYEDTRKFATKAWNYMTLEERNAYPNELLDFVILTETKTDLSVELETTWLELRNIINAERLETRLLTTMCRTFNAEGGVFALVKMNNIQLKTAQNIDKNNRNAIEMHRINDVLNYVKKTGQVYIKGNKSVTEGIYKESVRENNVFCLAIPFKRNGSVEAIIYLQSYYEGRQISEQDTLTIKRFADKMSKTIFSAYDYNRLTSEASFEENASQYGHFVDAKEKFCTSVDDEIIFINEQIGKVAKTNIPVLITGETGVGKEVFAKEVYKRSNYQKTFIKVNCGAIPESLIESELFGYEKGSFTGAAQRKKGYFELAEGGTIFLDEIGELSLNSQVKLLRILQEHELMRIGGTESIKVDFRLIAATNKELLSEVKKGTFRKDLYYRLNVIQFNIPPLRKRKKDIQNFSNYFIEKYCKEIGKPICTISTETIMEMMHYEWPGNIRELENVIQRAVLFAEKDRIKINFNELKNEESTGEILNSDLCNSEKRYNGNSEDSIAQTNYLTLVEMERRYIIEVLEACGWKIAGSNGAAQVLGIKRTTLISKMERLNIKRKTLF